VETRPNVWWEEVEDASRGLKTSLRYEKCEKKEKKLVKEVKNECEILRTSW